MRCSCFGGRYEMKCANIGCGKELNPLAEKKLKSLKKGRNSKYRFCVKCRLATGVLLSWKCLTCDARFTEPTDPIQRVFCKQCRIENCKRRHNFYYRISKEEKKELLLAK